MPRGPADLGEPFGQRALTRLSETVLRALVEKIVLGRFDGVPTLPSEQLIGEEFAVSRTVVRECVKRLEEKGLVAVSQGRGTRITPLSEWNVLDPVVLGALIEHDESTDVLDEVSVVRASLEGAMSAIVASRPGPETLRDVRGALKRMRRSLDDEDAFLAADGDFHFAVMAASGQRIAGNIARGLFVQARESDRYRGRHVPHSIELTLDEHEAIFAALSAGTPAEARQTMERHILDSWHRRRFRPHESLGTESSGTS